jgi:hypothetical protein
VGKLVSHYPIAGIARPIGVALHAFLAEVKRAAGKLKPPPLDVDCRHKKPEGPRCGECNASKAQQPKPPRNALHPAVVALVHRAEKIIEEGGDPVKGEFFFDFDAEVRVFMDASKDALGAVIYFGDIKVEDGTRSRKLAWRNDDRL